jgi:hypothetical protein
MRPLNDLIEALPNVVEFTADWFAPVSQRALFAMWQRISRPRSKGGGGDSAAQTAIAAFAQKHRVNTPPQPGGHGQPPHRRVPHHIRDKHGEGFDPQLDRERLNGHSVGIFLLLILISENASDEGIQVGIVAVINDPTKWRNGLNSCASISACVMNDIS